MSGSYCYLRFCICTAGEGAPAGGASTGLLLVFDEGLALALTAGLALVFNGDRIAGSGVSLVLRRSGLSLVKRGTGVLVAGVAAPCNCPGAGLI